MKKKKQSVRFPFFEFRWLFDMAKIVIVTAVISLAIIVWFGFPWRIENLYIILAITIPMGFAVVVSSVVILSSVRKKMSALLDAICAVAEGNLEVRLDTVDTEEYAVIYENFNRMVRELKNTKAEMQNFVNEFSHEFKTPITSILGFSEYLIGSDGGRESPERMKYLQIIASESRRLSELSRNTLLLSKMEACQIVTDQSRFCLAEQIRQCSILFLSQIEKKGLELEFGITGKVLYYGNEEMTEQIWINLIGNAVKFTPEGGSITIRLNDDGEAIVVSIADSGVGMNEETQKHIFEKYYQNDNVNAVRGNGIGLSIVKRIVTLCEGEITVESVEGEGSTFTVSLPKK